MKCVVSMVLAVFALTALADDTVKAAWFRKDISCEVGTRLAGYGTNDVSVAKLDDLEINGVCVDDGKDKILLMSFDLLGMDKGTIRKMRAAAAELLGMKEANVMLTCTHTHGGPHTRMSRQQIDTRYLDFLDKAAVDAVRELRENGVWREVNVGYFSSQCDENRNRRYTTADNCASFIAYRRTLHGIATGIADKELGTIAFFDPKTRAPLYVIGNYAAHPLATHAPGMGGRRITSDFPGYYRRYVESETGAQAMFVSGACGDLVPKDDELGVRGARKVGENLAMASVSAIIDIQRNAGRFMIKNPRVGGVTATFESSLRKKWRKNLGHDKEPQEIQCISIGDVAFVGVPGELVNELGLEIKWHSPYRRTFIAYCSTDYFGYIATENQVAAGGYEPQLQRFSSRDSLRLVETARDALFDLRGKLFPEDNVGEDGYPDNLSLPLLNLPGGVIERKLSQQKR